MTAPKVGDRVRVVLEGKVSSAAEDGFWVGATWIAPNDGDPVVSVEILRPPVKVGDVIETADELDALPTNAVVLNGKGCAMQKDRDDWYPANGHSRPVAIRLLPATVLYLPDGAA